VSHVRRRPMKINGPLASKNSRNRLKCWRVEFGSAAFDTRTSPQLVHEDFGMRVA